MSSEKATNEQMDEFNKLILNLKNINVQIDDEDQTLFLLCLLPKAHDHFKKTLFLWKKISLEEVQVTLSSKELNEKFKVKASSS